MQSIEIITRIVREVKCPRHNKKVSLATCQKCRWYDGLTTIEAKCHADEEILTLGFAVGEKYINTYWSDYTFPVTVTNVKKTKSKQDVMWWVSVEGIMPDGRLQRQTFPLCVAEQMLKPIESKEAS